MEEICYLISDASKKVDVETHVLRYWEEELGLAIPRNEMGHRYYTEFHIRLFCQVKALRDKGYQLKAIKSALQQLMEKNQEPVNAEEILEQDISRTLQENPRLGVLYRISVDKSGATRKVIEEQLHRREPSNIARLQDYSRLEKGSWDGEENRAVEEKTENQVEIEEKSQEIEKKDGQTEMKNKRKSRTKPSAWERRNGIVVKVKPAVGEDTAEEKELLRRDMEAAETGTKPVQGKEKPSEKGLLLEEKKPSEKGLLLEEKKPSEKGLLLEEKKPSEKEELLQEEGSLADGESLEKGELFIEEGAPTDNELGVAGETEIVLAQEKTELDRMTAKEKMEQFQAIMNQIIQRALEANNEKLSRDISDQVNQELAEELKSLMQIQNEQEEERFRRLDEMIRSCQRESQGKAEAAAARVPFFRRKWFEKGMG